MSIPPVTGAQLRNYHLAKQISREIAVTCLAFRPAELKGPVEEMIPGSSARIRYVPLAPGYSAGKLFRGLIGPDPVTVLNYTSAQMASELGRELDRERYEMVQVEGVHFAKYLPLIRSSGYPPSAVICDWHNIESELMYRYSERTSGWARRMYARRTAAQLEILERRVLADCDLHLVVSEQARRTVLQKAPGASVRVIENGVDVAAFSDVGDERYRAQRNRILYVGSMDYHANIDAVRYFANGAWKTIRREMPAVTFTIVGRDPAPEVRSLANLPGIEITGTVPEVQPYYREALAVVVPLRIGSGTRLKILEAMAAGVPVISSTLGAEGLDAQPGVHFIQADTEEAICRVILALARDQSLWKQLVAGGRRLAETRYDWSIIGHSLLEVYRSILAQGRDARQT